MGVFEDTNLCAIYAKMGDNPAMEHATGPSDIGQLALELIVPLLSGLGMNAEESQSAITEGHANDASFDC